MTEARSIPIVENGREIKELAAQVCANKLPGFQIREREWTMRQLVNILRTLFNAENAYFEFTPFRLGFDGRYTHLPAEADHSLRSRPHTDGTPSGLAMHRNLGAPRIVQLAHPLKDGGGTGQTFFPTNGKGKYLVSDEYDMFHVQDQVGIIYEGETVENRLTVFSEGRAYFGPGKQLLPTVHYFADGSAAHWERYSGYLDRGARMSEEFLEKLLQEV